MHATDKKQLSPFAHFRCAGAKAASRFLPQMQALYSKGEFMGYLKYGFFALFILVLQGCANPSIHNVNKSETGILNAQSKIYVPRFEGRPDFVEESTDYFVSLLESRISNAIIQGSVLRAESTDVISGGNLAPLELALQSAKFNKADILITGKVTSHNTIGTMNGFSTIRIYNVHTGKRIANFHEPSGLLFAYSEHQCVMASVKETAENVAALFK